MLVNKADLCSIDGAHLCNADSAGQASPQRCRRLLVVVIVAVVVRRTLTPILAKDLLSQILCLALGAICGCDVNCVFCLIALADHVLYVPALIMSSNDTAGLSCCLFFAILACSDGSRLKGESQY
jgi:hypothetical protein